MDYKFSKLVVLTWVTKKNVIKPVVFILFGNQTKSIWY